MIVSRSSRLPRKKILLAFGDAVCALGAIFAAVLLRLGWPDGIVYLCSHEPAIFTTWAIFLVAFYIGGLYENDRLQRPGRMLAAAILSVALGAVLVTAVFYATLSAERIGRGIFVGFAAFVFTAVVSMRLLFVMASRKGFMSQRSL